MKDDNQQTCCSDTACQTSPAEPLVVNELDISGHEADARLRQLESTLEWLRKIPGLPHISVKVMLGE